MSRIQLLLISLIAGLLPLAAADEFDQLLAEVDPPARFADHQPQFAVEETERSFQFSDGEQTWRFWVITDGDRVIGYMPQTGFHGGWLYLLTHDPAQAPSELVLPSERFHIDTAPGISFRTDHFLPGKNWNQGDQSSWTVSDDGSCLTLERSFAGTLQGNKWELNTSKNPLTVDHHGTFVLSCHPQLGYVIEATWDTAVDKPKDLGQYVSLYPPDMSNPWVTEGIHERVMTCPTGGGYLGHANNHAAIDKSDNDKGRWDLRDGGFTAYLDEDGGWSWAMTLAGASARLGVCNVHADQDLHVRWPSDLAAGDDGLYRHQIQARQLRMPPEMTAKVWEQTPVMFDDHHIVVIGLGETVDFEDQPLNMATPRIGMAFGGNQPTIATEHTRSGEKSLLVKGTLWPTVPQVVLKPDTTYRISGWYQVLPASEADLAKLKEKHADDQAKARKNWEKQVRKAKKKDREIPPEPEETPFVAPEEATAHITAHLYRWTPHNIGDRLIEQVTTSAGEGDWQEVELTFTTPAWGPFVDIRFVCAGGGTAYLDDFAIVEVE